jgi:hypothetical protein
VSFATNLGIPRNKKRVERSKKPKDGQGKLKSGKGYCRN